MFELLVNRQPKTLNSGLKTWGDLLEELDLDCEADRRTVTEVRFDGVDQPSYRSLELARRPLSSISRLEIEMVDRTRLLRNTLGAAGNSLPVLAASACRAAASFRGHDLSNAHHQLTSLVEAVRTLTILTVASATAAGTELEELSCGANTGSDVLGGVGVVLDSLAHWQQGRDWVAVADGLEYDLAPALLQWGVVFDAMEDRCSA
jgi:hypothetical protein